MNAAEFERRLNPPQLEAVKHLDGPLLVLAGAGSGKTRVITHRIAYMIGVHGVHPSEIIALTFTNKAAGEMKRRVEALLGAGAEVWVSTFHSTCARMLRSDGWVLKYPRDYIIYDDDDSKALVKKTLKEMNVPDSALNPQELSAYIDRAKNRGLDPSAAAEAAEDPEPVKAQGYALYQRRLKDAGAMDFGDLMMNEVAAWRMDRTVLDGWKRRFKHILVDEFQDTNAVQMEFLTLLAGNRKNLCVVGDDDQSIYRWRGAEVSNILSFERAFPGAKVVRLEQNYRSTQAVLSAANSVVSNNSSRHPKKLWTAGEKGAPVTIYAARDDRGEAAYVAGVVSKGRLLEKTDPSQFAVFIRTGAQSRVFEERFREGRIPYELVGGVRFYERKEIKDVLAYLRLCINRKSDVDFERVVNVPPRGIGDVTLERIRAMARSASIPLFDAARTAGGKLRPFIELMDNLGRRAESAPASVLTREILDATGYQLMLKGSRDPGDEERLANLDELISGMLEFEEAAGDGDRTITAFLEKAALTAEIDRFEEDGGKLPLMTLHSAKGLEFTHVFVTGCEEGLFPHSRSFDDPEELEEERRLMYVGMTRAMKTLHVTYAERRRRQGQYRDQIPSRFIREIPDATIKRQEGAREVESGGWRQQSVSGFHVRDRQRDRGDGTAIHYDCEGFREDAWAGKRTVPSLGRPGAEKKFFIGRKVRHELFGIGVVKGVDGDGEHRKLWVEFPTAGLKKIVERYVEWAD